MAYFLLGLFIGLSIGGVIIWSIYEPRIGKLMSRIVAVVAMGGGAAFLVWGILAYAFGEGIGRIYRWQIIETVSQALALGAGLLVVGVSALVLSFISSSRAKIVEVKESGNHSLG